jgi:hypothetical protein
VKTVYDLYHWSHPDAAAEITYGFDTMWGAAAATAEHHPGVSIDCVADPDKWVRTPDNNGWTIVDWWLVPLGITRSPWGIFERRVAENDTERVQLALALIASYGQTDGEHHKAWVTDQVVRLLTPDYEAWIARYRDGEDGPETYSWDAGIAP